MRRIFYLSSGIALLLFAISACSSLHEDQEKAQLHLRMGVALLSNENYPAALKELLTAEDLDPKDPVIQNNLGLAYFVRDRFELAELHFTKAVKIKTDYTEARNNLARTQIERKKYVEAQEELHRVLEDLTFPNPEKAWVNQGLLFFEQQKYSEARPAFQKAVEIQRENCIANDYLGRSHYELKEFKDAATALDRAVAFCQKSLFDEPAYYSAMSYLQLSQKDKAFARFNEVIQLYPNGKYREKSKSMLEILK